MAIKKSVIENMELDSGTEVFVQSSRAKVVTLSFDGHETQYTIYIKSDDASKLADLIKQVIREAGELPDVSA